MAFRLRTGISAAFEREQILKEQYDVVVVGGGPAGLTAALYTARYGLNVLLVTKSLGGLVSEAPLVDDYPGVPEVTGNDLVDRFVKHVKKYGVPIIIDEVVNIYKKAPDSPLWCIELKNTPHKPCSYAVIIAIGSEKRELQVPGERELKGKGVSYCAVCDGPLFKGKTVAVVGGGNSALTAALFLSNYASKVYLIHRRDSFRAFQVYVEAAKSNPRIEILTNTIVKEILGSDHVEAIRVENVKTREERVIPVSGVFIEIGLRPNTEFFRKIGIEVDEEGRAKVNVDMSTNLPGIYVAGDAAGGPFKYKFEQIITAAAEGAIAADAASKYVMALKRGQARL
ncbi:MAG: NAD(P)/FAD-dependent oxidoreductase [Desulfurococcaceae archaeon]